METDEMVAAAGESVDAADRGLSEQDQQQSVEAPGDGPQGGVGEAGDPEVVVEMKWSGSAGDISPSVEEEWNGFLSENAEGPGEEDWNGFLSGTAEGPGKEDWNGFLSETAEGPGKEDWNGFLSGTAEGPVEEGREESAHPEWKRGDPVTPQHVLRLRGYTREFLCSPEDNVYNINFSRFKIRELQSGAVILDIKKHCPTEIKDVFEVDPGRFIQYHFSPAFLALKEIGATLEFTVGRRAVNRLRLIERHFFRDLLLKTFDFEIGFCIPFSRNTCEHIYSLPDLDPSTIAEMVASPFETRSDSFYFANNRLIMHHKAEYSFDRSDPVKSLSQ